MTKKRITLGILILLAIAVSVFFLAVPRALGTMNNRYTEAATTASSISFSAEPGDTFRFLFDSHVESGDLDIVLYDSSGKEVYVDSLAFVDRASYLKTFFTLDRSDTYTLEAQCVEFVGDYKVRLYQA